MEKNVLKNNEETEKLKKKEILRKKDRLLTHMHAQSAETPDEYSAEYQKLQAPRKDKKLRSYSSESEHSSHEESKSNLVVSL